MAFRPVPDKTLLVCASCGSERQVDDRPVGTVPLAEWWAARGRRCTPCFEAGRPQMPDPTAATPVPTGRDHPDTSCKAAEMAAPRAGSQRALLLDLMLEVEEFGVTAYEAAVAIDRSPNQTAARLQELRDQGWVVYKLDDGGNRVERRTTPGSTGLVQVLSDAGRRLWTSTGYAGHPKGVPLPEKAEGRPERAARKRKPARPAQPEDEAVEALRRSGLLEGATEISPGLARLSEELAARGVG